MSDDEDRKRLKRKKLPKREYTVIALDVGSNMCELLPTGISCFEMAKKILDWLITRKIFTDSPDEFTLLLFGHEDDEKSSSLGTSSDNILFCIDEMESAKFDWLKRIDKELKMSIKQQGDYLSALIKSIDFMRTCLEDTDQKTVIARNILIISNLLGCGSTEERMDEWNAASNGIKALDISLNIVGPSLDQKSLKIKEENVEEKLITNNQYNAVQNFVEQVNGVIYSFENILPMLQKFVPRQKTSRGQKFFLELGKDLKLPLQLYKKVQQYDLKLKFKKFDDEINSEVKKETIFSKSYTEGNVISTGSDIATNEKQENPYKPKLLTKKDVIKGYNFGKTIIPFNEDDAKEYGWNREPRCMKLLQFTRRSQIFQHYLMDGGVYYCIPPSDDENTCTAIDALVNAMIAEDFVALIRFVYSAASYPRIMALFPKISKKGAPLFMGIFMPFYEDFRGIEFPPLDEEQFKPRAEQLRAMEAFVSSTDLTKSTFDPLSGEYIEDLRPRDVLDPKLQRTCEVIKHRALHPNETLPTGGSFTLGQLFKPIIPSDQTYSEALSIVKEKFELYTVKPKKRKGMYDETDEASQALPGFGVDDSTLPESGKFIKLEDMDTESYNLHNPSK